MLSLKNGFEITDCDCMQCCKYLGERKYLFIQAIWLDTCKGDERADNSENDFDNFVVVSDTIDVSEMSETDIEIAVSGFYESVSDMENSYNIKGAEADQLIAECEFENYTDESCYEYVSSIVSWKGAEKIIQDFINNNNEM